MEDKLLTAAQVAKLLDAGEQYVRELVTKGEIPHLFLPGKKRGLRFRESEIQGWIAKLSEEQREERKIG